MIDQAIGIGCMEKRAYKRFRRRCPDACGQVVLGVEHAHVMMIWLFLIGGWAWNLRPIKRGQLLVPLKLRAETVSAEAKNAVVFGAPRASAPNPAVLW